MSAVVFTPARRLRTKVLHRCTDCGAEFRKSDVTLVQRKASPLAGSLAHRKRSGWCGPIAFEENPEYRKQRG